MVCFRRKHQPCSPERAVTSASNTGVTQEVPEPEVADEGHDSDLNSYHNMGTEYSYGQGSPHEERCDQISLTRFGLANEYASVV